MAAQRFSNLPIEESGFFHQWQADSLEQFTEQHIAAFAQPTISSESDSPAAPPPAAGTVLKPLARTSSWSSCSAPQPVTAATLLCFGRPAAKRSAVECAKADSSAVKKKSCRAVAGEVVAPAGLTRHNHEHILAERKRREKLTQRFIALSKLIPGLKKMDKGSVLDDAIKYMKHLQEQVKALEDRANKPWPVEAASVVTKCQLLSDGDGSTSDMLGAVSPDMGQPVIEAKMFEKSVLLKIQCENHKGVLIKALAEVERLNLTVMNANAIPFTANSLDITIMAQVGEEFQMTTTDIVRRLSIALKIAACEVI